MPGACAVYCFSTSRQDRSGIFSTNRGIQVREQTQRIAKLDERVVQATMHSTRDTANLSMKVEHQPRVAPPLHRRPSRTRACAVRLSQVHRLEAELARLRDIIERSACVDELGGFSSTDVVTVKLAECQPALMHPMFHISLCLVVRSVT